MDKRYTDNANMVLTGVLDLLPETGEEGDPNAARNACNLTALFSQLDIKGLLKSDALNNINKAYKESYAASTTYVRASQRVADAQGY